MRALCLVLSLFLTAACGSADAATANRPALSVEFTGDSARVIARWARPCDRRGCADSYRVQWTAGGAARLRTTPATADTAMVALPPVGDSVVATVAVTALRRGLPSPARSASVVVRNPDAPPPAVDSLRADTLSAYEAALLDSFPLITVRDSLGNQWGEVAVGETVALCLLGEHRYTGEIRSFVAGDAPPDAEAVADRVCAYARAQFGRERQEARAGARVSG